MDKLADGLQKLNEDDLLQVVQMVHDNKTADSYTKNDVESTSRCTSIQRQNTNQSTNSGRIPRRSVHPPGYTDQDAVGFYSRARRSLSSPEMLLTGYIIIVTKFVPNLCSDAFCSFYVCFLVISFALYLESLGVSGSQRNWLGLLCYPRFILLVRRRSDTGCRLVAFEITACPCS